MVSGKNGEIKWLSRDLWDKLGGFPEWFGALAEDMYICCLARLFRYKVRAIARSKSERNKSLVMIMILPFHILFLCLEGLFLSCMKKDKKIWVQIYWNCIKEIWKFKSILIKKRYEIQRKRTCSLVPWIKVMCPVPYKLRMLIRHGVPKFK